MNTTQVISASGAIFMTAMMVSGIAAMADRNLSLMGDTVASASSATPHFAARNATPAAAKVAPTASQTAKPVAVKVAADVTTPTVRQSALDNATINKWNRLNQEVDSQTMFA